MKTTSIPALSTLLSAAAWLPLSAAEESYAQLDLDGFEDLSLSLPVNVGTAFAKTGKAGFGGGGIGGVGGKAAKRGKRGSGSALGGVIGTGPAADGFLPPTRSDARTCAGLCLERVVAADCPRDAGNDPRQRLPNCYAETIKDGEFCDAFGECGTEVSTTSNCNVDAANPNPQVNSDVYRRKNCALGGNDNGGDGSGICQNICLVPLDPTDPLTPCPQQPEALQSCRLDETAGAGGAGGAGVVDINSRRVGSLCEGDGFCGSDNNLNNCGEFDVYRIILCVPPAIVFGV